MRRASICRNRIFVDADQENAAKGGTKYLIKVDFAGKMLVHTAKPNRSCYVDESWIGGSQTCLLHLRNNFRVDCKG